MHGRAQRGTRKVTSELKTDTRTAGYQPATKSLSLGRMGVGKGALE